MIEDGSDVEPAPGSVPYEDALAGQSTERDFGPRSGDDIYILYTGGTTGMPKGVVWRHEDVFYALGGGIDPMSNERVTDPATMAPKGAGGGMVHLPVAPLMHGATQWCVMGQSFVGSKIVLMAKFDPHEVWELVGDEKVNSIMITGDAMGKPLVETLDDEGTRPRPLVARWPWSPPPPSSRAPVKDQFFEQLPNLVITDAIGSSEGGNNGLTVVTAGNTAMKSGPTVHLLGETVVFDEDLNPVEPGSGVIGKIARSGDIPLGYYNDPKKTAEVFIQVRGTRYVMPGDYATVEADGSHHLAGPGLHRHQLRRREDLPRRGRVRRALTPRRHGRHRVRRPRRALGPDGGGHHSAARRATRRRRSRRFRSAAASSIAGYKLPRRLYVVDKVERSPSREARLHVGHAIVKDRRVPDSERPPTRATLVRQRRHNFRRQP